MNVQKKITSGLVWSFAERIAAQLVSTIVSIILARLLEPDHYGIISIVMIFISFCNIFVSDGIGKTLVQKKEADHLDFDTLFWTSFAFACVLYAILFIAAPFIENFYKMSQLCVVIRVLGFRLILTSVNTIQQAYVQRKMEFKKFFYATLFGTVASAFVGIFLALRGWGVWALVVQYLTNTTVDTIVLYFTCGWKPKFAFSVKRLQIMFPFATRVLLQSLVYTAEDNIRSLIIGKKFGSSDLAFYDKGKQFPQLLITNLNSSISKVMLPAFSSQQDSVENVKKTVRMSISVGLYILCPAMIGFCAVGDTFISLLLTEKWLPCVPYLRILCIALMMRPYETTCSSAVLGLGRSDITLRNMIIINTIALGYLVIAVFGFKSVLLIAFGTLFETVISISLYSNNVRKLLGYRVKEQISDCAPSIMVSAVMGICVYLMSYLHINTVILLLIQVFVGGGVYIILSYVFHLAGFQYVLHKLRGKRSH